MWCLPPVPNNLNGRSTQFKRANGLLLQYYIRTTTTTAIYVYAVGMTGRGVKERILNNIWCAHSGVQTVACVRSGVNNIRARQYDSPPSTRFSKYVYNKSIVRLENQLRYIWTSVEFETKESRRRISSVTRMIEVGRAKTAFVYVIFERNSFVWQATTEITFFKFLRRDSPYALHTNNRSPIVIYHSDLRRVKKRKK